MLGENDSFGSIEVVANKIRKFAGHRIQCHKRFIFLQASVVQTYSCCILIPHRAMVETHGAFLSDAFGADMKKRLSLLLQSTVHHKGPSPTLLVITLQVKERLGIICATQQASLDEKAQLQAGIREN